MDNTAANTNSWPRQNQAYLSAEFACLRQLFSDREQSDEAKAAELEKCAAEQRSQMLKTRDLFGFWQGLLRVVGSFGDCPRCLAVCPVGNDYHAHLAEAQKVIPERTPEKAALQKQWQQARKAGKADGGLSDWNARWVGPEGYKGMVAKQLQEFKRKQKELSGDLQETADSGRD